jgi:flagellar L-ring protein precursor FlgH
MFSGTSKDTFKGTGKTSRDGNLKGTISARVVDVFPDGNLMIEGTRELKINSESQYLILSGIVRPKDIKSDNTISSTKLADARIAYTGGGSLSEKTSPGWFSRLLGVFAPF